MSDSIYDYRPPRTLTTTVVEYAGRQFYVSTHDRYCSSPMAPDMRYAETIAWELSNGRLGKMLGQCSAAAGSTREHEAVVERLRQTGQFDQSELPT